MRRSGARSPVGALKAITSAWGDEGFAPVRRLPRTIEADRNKGSSHHLGNYRRTWIRTYKKRDCSQRYVIMSFIRYRFALEALGCGLARRPDWTGNTP